MKSRQPYYLRYVKSGAFTILLATLGLSACSNTSSSQSPNVFSLDTAIKAQQTDASSFSVLSPILTTLRLNNPLNKSRDHELVVIPQESLPAQLNPNIEFVLFYASQRVAYQWVTTSNGSQALALQMSFRANESKTLTFHPVTNGELVKVQNLNAYAELAVRYAGVKNKKGVFSNGEYLPVEAFTLPGDHTVGNKYFKYEGFGWESNLIAYRYYFDTRAAIDVFGKQENGLVLPKVGLDGNNYHAIADWGMDVLKVGSSLGLGAVAALQETDIHKVSQFAKKSVSIDNNSVFASIHVQADQWQVGNIITDANITYRIAGNQYLTEVLAQAPGITEWAVGFVDHSKDPKIGQSVTIINASQQTGTWCYQASFGKQSLHGDNLGLAVFYPCTAVPLPSNDNVSVAVSSPQAHYYFMAGWEAQGPVFKTLTAFTAHLDETQLRLNNPIDIQL